MTAEQKSAFAGVVTIGKDVTHGTPCFAHARVPVQTLIDFLKTGETIDDFLTVGSGYSGSGYGAKYLSNSTRERSGHQFSVSQVEREVG